MAVIEIKDEALKGRFTAFVAALGKSGSISGLLKGMGAMSPDERREQEQDRRDLEQHAIRPDMFDHKLDHAIGHRRKGNLERDIRVLLCNLDGESRIME